MQAHAILTVDFAHVDTIFLRRLYILVVIEHGRRYVHVAGITARPTGAWVTQQARNLLMDLGERADRFRFLIRDRDSKFTAAFDAGFASAGIRIIRTQSGPGNAIAERFIGTLRRECLDHLLITGPRHLDAVLREYLGHYNAHRPHRSLHQHPPAGATARSPEHPSNRCDETDSAASYMSTCRSRDATGFSAPTGNLVFRSFAGAARSAGRSDAPGMARSVILEGEGESIDGVCTTLVRVIRRCFPAPPYRARWPTSWPCSGRALPHRHSLHSSACLLV